MEIDDPVEALFGWKLLAIREPCPIHGVDCYDVQAKRQKHLNVCPVCWRDRRKRNNALAFAKRKIMYPRSNYVADQGAEGSNELANMFSWPAECDRNIERFWNERGMTEEDAILKFGSNFKARAILRARKQRAEEEQVA